MDLDADLAEWLLDSDPALRWQVERDLLGLPESVWGATRELMLTEGFASRLLALQDSDGQWDGGAYFPGSSVWAGGEPPAEDEPEGDAQQSSGRDQGQPWTATTWTLNTLRDWGLPAEALAGTAEKLAHNSRWEYDGLPYWGGEVDVCINGFTLANGAWLGADVSGLAEWFPQHRLADGGWNCEWVEGSVRSSFHSTLNALRGILYYESVTGTTARLHEARRGAEEYLLERHLLYRKTDRGRVGEWSGALAYPLRWKCTALRAIDYFAAAARFDGSARDPRLEEAVELVRSARTPEGKWIQGVRDPGKVWFEVDVPAGQPSKWLTFYATRALAWWDAAAS